MIALSRPFLFGSFVVLAAALGSGCERVRTLAKTLTAGGATKSAAGSGEQVIALDDSTYGAFIAQQNKLLVVDFYADWCPPCRQLGPILEKAAAAHPAVVFVGRVNVDKAHSLAAENQVQNIPDVRIFKDGRQVDRFVGCPDEAEVLAKIAALAEGIKPAVAAPAKPAAVPEPALRPMPKDWHPPGIKKL